MSIKGITPQHKTTDIVKVYKNNRYYGVLKINKYLVIICINIKKNYIFVFTQNKAFTLQTTIM